MLLLATLIAALALHPVPTDDDAQGSALPVTGKPVAGAIEAAFPRRSYTPGAIAVLRVATPAPGMHLSVYRAGAGHDGTLQGARVTKPGTSLRVPIGDWPSGLYYVRLAAPQGRLGYASFIVRPKALGGHRIAVVLPTNTWQAYNFYDADGDGKPDSWYANPETTCVDLARPFLDLGVPPHYRGYDRGFIRWLFRAGKQVDVLSDDDLEQIATGDRLAARYDLIVFPGHEEYVMGHTYDIVERYRDLAEAVVKLGEWLKANGIVK